MQSRGKLVSLRNMKGKIFIFLSSVLLGLMILGVVEEVMAQDMEGGIEEMKTLEGEIVEVVEEKLLSNEGGEERYWQVLAVKVVRGELVGEVVQVENGSEMMSSLERYGVGDVVMISWSKDFEGGDVFYITDYVRRDALFWLFVIFVLMVVLISRWQGVSSLLGMAVSFGVIFKFVLPRIAVGDDPVVVAILGSLAIIPATFLLSHGVNKKTWIAIAGTLMALVVTGVMANVFVKAANLTGFASEEAGFLQAYNPGLVNIKGILLAGIIIGVLGVLDDITVSQSGIVEQLKKANSKLKAGELYRQAMVVGKDHIASMVNTLVLVYTGAALPLLLLFVDNPRPFVEIVNYEIIADEVVRTLVGSIGLMLAVPITTLIAALAVEGD